MDKIIFNVHDSMNRDYIYDNNHFIYMNKYYDTVNEIYREYGKSLENMSFKIYWTYTQKEYHFYFQNSNTQFLIDPTSGLIICRWFMLDGELTDSTYFFNLDGTINHKLVTPNVVYYKRGKGIRGPNEPIIPSTNEDMTKIGYYPVEDVPAVINFDEEYNSLICHYYYKYDWILYRKYDAINQKWGEIVSYTGERG